MLKAGNLEGIDIFMRSGEHATCHSVRRRDARIAEINIVASHVFNKT